MAKIETGKQARFSSDSHRVNTPEGTLYVMLLKDTNEKLVGIQLNLGKSGTIVAAWANALSRICSLALDHGASIPELVAELSMQTSDRVSLNSSNAKIRSGPEGIAYALMRFLEERSTNELSERDREYRPPRLGIRRALG